ncbi:MAG: helix-hairpin-helix domain-containing protein [Streptosporangiaceae bacterium]
MWRKTYLWLISIAGAGTCIAVLAAALAPSPGNHYQPVGGVLGSLGLLFSIWIGWCAHRVPLGAPDSAPVTNSLSEGKPGITAANDAVIRDSRDLLLARRKALAIVRDEPDLATELRIGRPDLPRSFDDGGLVDVNHVPASFLVERPGIDAPLAERIVATRDEVGGFGSIADLEITLELAPMTIRQVKDRLIFRPIY